MKQQSDAADPAAAAAGMGSASASGTTDNTAQSGVAGEFQAFLSDVEDLISSATSLTGEDLTRTKAKLGARINSARASIEKVGSAVSDQARGGASAADSYVRTQPWQAVGIGAAAGILIGYLLGRRGS
ncbi:MAG TPA: DUF883 family protein [Steroidobacteraceae bacterium]|jgi:ElaB/YqjD/DUF883 family membrane-anchored ribosome-binding protein|nr:DUF883 family protein [Steroidobacteraceae bacterium]